MATATGMLAAERRVSAQRDAKVAEHHSRVAKNLLLFLAAPWIGLAYIIAFPFVGMYALARVTVTRS